MGNRAFVSIERDSSAAALKSKPIKKLDETGVIMVNIKTAESKLSSSYLTKVST